MDTFDPPISHQGPTAEVFTANVAPPPSLQNATRVAESPPTELPRRMSRAEAQAMRRAERDEGFDWPLPKTKLMGRVRDLTFVDKVLLGAIPAGTREFINAAIASGNIRGLASVGAEGMSIEKLIEVAEAEEGLANAICIQGFIYPRLYASEAEIPAGDPDAWLVTELAIQERRDYMNYVLNNSSAELKEDQRRFGNAKSGRVEGDPMATDGGSSGQDNLRVVATA